MAEDDGVEEAAAAVDLEGAGAVLSGVRGGARVGDVVVAPFADVAVFITDLIYGDRFELTAYDSQGNILDSVSRVASVNDPDG